MVTTRTTLITAALLALPSVSTAQSADRPPVIDVHMHAPMRPGPVEELASRLPATLARMDSLNIRYAVVNGVPDVLSVWHEAMKQQVGVMPSLQFPCYNGQTVMFGRQCFANGGDWPDLAQLRADIEAGRVQALGEITTQFLGLGPSDPPLEPYLALAEEYDLPVFIHMGPGTPGTAYEGGEAPLPAPEYRANAGNPLELEEALLRHPGVRVAVMHAGWPLADQMIFTLYQHPQVYAEIGLLDYTDWIPRKAYYDFLKRLVDAGFGDRILFGSDGGPRSAIEAILEADFLTDQQKRDILCNNAVRFLRLDGDICA